MAENVPCPDCGHSIDIVLIDADGMPYCAAGSFHDRCHCPTSPEMILEAALDAANAKLDAVRKIACWVTDGDPDSQAQMIVDLIDGED